MDSKILGNVGSLTGQNGIAAVYVGKTAGGTFYLAYKMLVDEVTTWRYLSLSGIKNAMALGNAMVATDFNLDIVTDIALPDFTDKVGPFPTVEGITNGADLPRLYSYENPYTLKGEGISVADLEQVKKLGTGSARTFLDANGDGKDDTTGQTLAQFNAANNTGALGGIIPSDFSTLFSNPVKFVQDNPVFIVGVLALVYYLRRKKKKPLWIF